LDLLAARAEWVAGQVAPHAHRQASHSPLLEAVLPGRSRGATLFRAAARSQSSRVRAVRREDNRG
jgi:hypothetical protein